MDRIVVAPAEPPKVWYTSKGVWGSIVSMGAGFLALLHIMLDQAVQLELTEIAVGTGALVGGAVALYGRIRAVAPVVWKAVQGVRFNVAPFLATMIALQMLSACAMLPKTVDEKARQTVGLSFTLYAQVWQPSLRVYSSLEYCGEPASPPCRDRDLYRKLYDADAAVVACARVAVSSLLSEEPDYTLIAPCIGKVEQAKLSFARARIMREDVAISLMYLSPTDRDKAIEVIVPAMLRGAS